MKRAKRFGHRFPSRLGDIFCVVDDGGALVRLDFVGSADRAATNRELERSFTERGYEFAWKPGAVQHVTEALQAYFDGRATSFELAVNPDGSEFQRAVWRELARVGYGETISYGELARRVGRPGAARAVGRANATNPISLVVPCHRVIGASGALTGYAGGVERKRALLEMERAASAI